jgi:Restriction endonuclease
MQLWEQVKARNTPGWDPGKAFEYLVLRMFDLDKAEVRWPYSVKIGDDEVEQIDGSVRSGSQYFLVESKDEAGNVNLEPVAKLRNQLLRRPAGTIGLLFSSQEFTDPALLLTQFTLPQTILLWTGGEVELALKRKGITEFLERKFRLCVDEGKPDFDITFSRP